MRLRAFLLACLMLLPTAPFAVRLWADEPAKPAPAATKEPSAKATTPKETAPDKAAKARDAEAYELQKLFADTIDQVERNYVKDISRRELMEAAIRGVLSKLDPYSNYIGPDDLGRFKTAVDSEFGGIGIQVDLPRDGRLVVVSPLVGSPAYRAGLQAGDEIVEIEGQSTDNIRQIDDAIRRLKGEAGSKVTITLLRPSTGRRKTVTIEREIIQLETVMGDQRTSNDRWDFMLDHEKRIGYIRLTAFSRDTERDLRTALEELQKEHMRGLILDLRFNPGGLLTSAIGVADLFVPEGRIVSTEGRNSTPRSWDAQKSGTFEGFPMVVLVNRYSASASEIVSACLQDHNRAAVIGERTWGKGSVQNVIELEGGKSALKLTTAGYMRPSGKNIHKGPDAKDTDEWGVSPNKGMEVKLDDMETARLVRYRHDRDVLLVNHSKESAEVDKPPEKSAEAKAAEATKPDDKKPDKKADGKAHNDKKAADSKAADPKNTDQTPMDGKAGDAKADDKKSNDDKTPNGDRPDAKKADEKKTDEAKTDDKKVEEKKPGDAESGPAKPEADKAKASPKSDEAGDPSKAAGPSKEEEKRPAFVDRQLQKAIDYLNGELAKAG